MSIRTNYEKWYEGDEYYWGLEPGSFLIYSTGTVQYLFEENKAGFFEKPFLELPPDWDKEEKMWKPGELFTFFADLKVEKINEVIFEDNSGGVPHYHCMDTIICRRVV